MTDNRTNEPTEAMVQAAAKAMWDLRKRASDPEWEGGELDHGIKEIYRQDARAALVAAQGAAPQAESDERIQAWERMIQHPVWRSCFEEERPLIDSVMERIDNLADLEMTVNELAPAPVLPSSTVDEALRFCTCSHWLEAHHERKCLEHHCACVNFQPVLQIDEDALAEVIAGAQNVPFVGSRQKAIARAVAEWLKGQGR